MEILKLYDENKKSSWIIPEYKNLYIEEDLDTGLKRLYCSIPTSSTIINIIQEEMYLETENYRYIVKEINKNNNNYYEIYCDGDIEELYGNPIQSFDVLFSPLSSCLNIALNNTNWSYEIMEEIPGTYTITIEYCSTKEVLDSIKTYFNLEYQYDTKNKKIFIYSTRGSNKGAFFFSELNLKELKVQSNTYNFATRIIPIGKNNINISSINNEKMFLENHSYSNKNIVYYWVNDDCTTPESLLSEAKKKIMEISIPTKSYQIKISNLNSSIDIGDTIIIIDDYKKIKDTQRVKKKIIYPNNPELNMIEVSNKIVTFDMLQAMTNKNFSIEINKIKRKV